MVVVLQPFGEVVKAGGEHSISLVHLPHRPDHDSL
jgi:hypothetical protein